jgi:hypothetical protein
MEDHSRTPVLLLAAMVDLNVETGLAALCLGGGNVVVLSVAEMPGGGARR